MTAQARAAIIRPIRDGSHVQTLPQGSFGRLKRKRGYRQLIYGGGLFFKIGRTDSERTMIAQECTAAQAAARRPFWGDLPVKVYRVANQGFVGRRGRPATSNDFDGLMGIVERQFDAALAHPRTDVVEAIVQRPLFAHLNAEERRALLVATADLQLPRTSMHGDLHVFNFVFVGGTPRLADWEFFDPEGSFVYDYLDFFISVASINSDDPWHMILRRLQSSHPALVAVAARLGAAPEALLAYYMFLKLNILMSLHGTFTTVNEQFFHDHMAGFRQILGQGS